MIDQVAEGLAVFRVTRLVVSDTIFDTPRDAVLDRLDEGGPVARKVGEGIACPWCISVWIAFGWLAFRRLAPRTSRVFRDGLALSAAAGLLSGHEYDKG